MGATTQKRLPNPRTSGLPDHLAIGLFEDGELLDTRIVEQPNVLDKGGRVFYSHSISPRQGWVIGDVGEVLDNPDATEADLTKAVKAALESITLVLDDGTVMSKGDVHASTAGNWTVGFHHTVELTGNDGVVKYMISAYVTFIQKPAQNTAGFNLKITGLQPNITSRSEPLGGKMKARTA